MEAVAEEIFLCTSEKRLLMGRFGCLTYQTKPSEEPSGNEEKNGSGLKQQTTERLDAEEYQGGGAVFIKDVC